MMSLTPPAQDATKAPAKPPPITSVTVPGGGGTAAGGTAGTTTITTIGGGGGKKKFGKNLNKLTAAAAAPVTNNNKQQTKQENGMLLLSAKRGSTPSKFGSGARGSGGGSGGAGGGLLANKSNNSTTKANVTKNNKPALALHTDMAPSTHDALLGVVVGASRQQQQQQRAGDSTSSLTAAAVEKPDAWRVAEFKQHDLERQQQQKEKEDRVVDSDPKKQQEGWNRQQQQEQQHHRDDGHHDRSTEGGQDEVHFKTTNWDEYGGRDATANASSRDEDEKIHHGDNEDPKEPKNDSESEKKKKNGEDPNNYMAKKARERAAQRRQEEEKRMLAQKERAAERLRQLDEKAGRSKNQSRHSDDGDDRGSTTENAWQKNPQQPINVRALGLDRNPNNETPTDRMERNSRRQNNGSSTSSNGRSLYDPNSPSGAGSKARQQKSNDRSPRMSAVGGPSACRNDYRPRLDSEADRSRSDTEEKHEVIHLSSYDDQDRGAAAGGPRMLFDPKSGSMVEAGSSGPPSAKASRRPARARKGRNSQRSDAGWDTGGRGSGGTEGRGGRGAGRGRGAPWMAEGRKKEFPEPPTRPRTCGVLYARDDNRNFYCVDGEEPDLGYGAHSVPGGRIKNPEAYAKYEETRKQVKQGPKARKEKKAEQREQAKKEKPKKPTIRSKRWKNNSGPDDMGDFDGVEDEPGVEMENEESALQHDWVTANDRLELITGVESPTLQATAKEFSPAAFKIQEAKQGKKSSLNHRGKGTPNPKTRKNNLSKSQVDDDEAQLGLGFDPSFNMDSVIQSPMVDPINPPDGLHAVDLTALSLEPALQGSTKTTSHIFAFESGSTWGANSHGGIGASEWGVTSNSPRLESNSWNIASSAAGESKGFASALPTSFLSLPSNGNSWGGFGTASTLNGGDQRGSTGD